MYLYPLGQLQLHLLRKLLFGQAVKIGIKVDVHRGVNI